MFLYGEGAGCDHTHIHNMTYRIKRRELCVEFCFYLLPFYFSSPFFFMDFSLFGENISNTPRNKSVNLGNFLHFHEIEGQQNFVTESISHGISLMIRFSTRTSNMHIRVPRRDLIVIKRNDAKNATAQSCRLGHRRLLLQGFWCTVVHQFSNAHLVENFGLIDNFKDYGNQFVVH